MSEYAIGGIVERGNVGEHGDLIPAVLDGCTYYWPHGCWTPNAEEARDGLLKRINDREP